MAPLVTPEITSNIQWIAQMNVDVEPTAGRKTTVIGTIGKVYYMSFKIKKKIKLLAQVPRQTVLK
ncbi:hypothetical protein BD770DRAFT_135033 [Pilaira anomala]|nr:hypothetical protein BD770DRAFT_135033 [Pilaira anomala]